MVGWYDLWLADRLWDRVISRRSDTGIRAYRLSDGTRQQDKDYDYWWGESPDNRINFGKFVTFRVNVNMYPLGIWSDGTTTLVSLDGSRERDESIAAYVAIPLTKRLEAGSITATAATLKLHWHTGNWHYKANTGPHTACSTPAQTEPRPASAG